MSERINVDHAFDPEARQAQAEFDAYMDSRPYQDDKGNVHNPEDGKFVNYDAYSETAREDHYDESLAEGDYSGESLQQLAERVAAARAEGDRTRAEDAENAFYEKFTAYTEKYGWDKEDDSVTDEVRLDKDAPMGRTTIDDRLERYTKVMYGETDTETTSEKDAEPSEKAPESDAKPDETVETPIAATEEVKDGSSDIAEAGHDRVASVTGDIFHAPDAAETDVPSSPEAAEKKDTLPAGHVEYDGKQWEVIEINTDSKTGDRSFHLVYRNEKGHVTHKTVGESELNLPESTGDEEDAILDDTSWAGEAVNTEYPADKLSEDPIDLSETDWIENAVNPAYKGDETPETTDEDDSISDAETAWVDEAVAKRDEAITVDTRGRARRYLDSRKERANGKEKGRLRRIGAAVAALALAATAVIGIGNSVKNYSNEIATSLSSEDASADEAWDSDDNSITPTEEAASTDKVLPLPDSYYEKQEADASPAGEISFTVGAEIGSDGDAEVVVDENNSSTAESTSEAIGNFSDKARTIERGEGGFQTLKELGVAESDWEETWQEVGEKLIEAGHDDMVYQMDDGRWGWAQSGTLSNDQLRVIAEVINQR